jgi:hypothetical protein
MNEETSDHALVVLAAGLGSRYGNAKQIAGIGPNGEWLLEYAVHDALATGFTQVVMVISAELREALQQRLAPPLQGRAVLHFIEQSYDHVPSGCRAPGGRGKPLGTGHALWCCAPLLRGPFAVVNADDYYGHDAFALLARHFRGHTGPAMIGYRLDATLSPHGTVNRGVCKVDPDGFLDGVTEYTRIGIRDDALQGTAPDGSDHSLSPDAVVSLNCWGLLPELLHDLETGLREFLGHAGAADEYFLPDAIDRHLARSSRGLAVLRGDCEWLGLTYPDDRAHVAARIAALHAAGRYPTPLWPAA